jgi:hypothetical protein
MFIKKVLGEVYVSCKLKSEKEDECVPFILFRILKNSLNYLIIYLLEYSIYCYQSI